MVKKDYQSGTYKGGKFRPYEKFGEYSARMDSHSNKESKNLISKGEVIHGTYKDGVFRPADTRGRPGYANTVTLDSGENYKFNSKGEFYDIRGKAVGKLNENGRPEFYRNPPHERNHERNFGRDIESDENEKYRDLGLANGGEVRGYANEGLTNLANYISRSNKVLGKLRKAQKSYDPKTGTKIRVYEAEIPQYNAKSGLGAGFNAETTDGGEHIIVVDKRLKPYQKMAIVAHELSHVHGGSYKNPREEHDAHLAAINQLSSLYGDYDDIKKATSGSDNPFFDVKKQSKEEIGRAVAYLVGTRNYFGVKEEELQNNVLVFRKIKKDLENIVAQIISVSSITLSIFFLSSNITGNAIADLPIKANSFIGAGLFIISLIAGFFWLKSKVKFDY